MGVVGAAVLGHMYSPFRRLQGGQGVATGLGAMLGVYPADHVPAWRASRSGGAGNSRDLPVREPGVVPWSAMAHCRRNVWFFARQSGHASEAWMAPFYVVSALVALAGDRRGTAPISSGSWRVTEHRIGISPKR
jgi:hypothetical protein